MDQHLNLIKNNIESVEKRIFPRFPFCSLTFKSKAEKNEDHAFEVVDISSTGAQLNRRMGGHGFLPDDLIQGFFHWNGAELKVKGHVKWVSGSRMGIFFEQALGLDVFLSTKHILTQLRPVHQMETGVEVPGNLRYWIRCDGPVELFVWTHRDNEISCFQMIYFHEFIEWRDGKGLKSGRLITKRDLETPLMSEDEFVFNMDGQIDGIKLVKAKDLLVHLSNELLPEQVRHFVCLKLGGL